MKSKLGEKKTLFWKINWRCVSAFSAERLTDVQRCGDWSEQVMINFNVGVDLSREIVFNSHNKFCLDITIVVALDELT